MSDRKIVGSPLNFRSLVYSPINEQGVVYLFGIIANDLNIRVESIQQGYPDCTAIRYVGKGKWERINIEFEYRSSNFDHDPACMQAHQYQTCREFHSSSASKKFSACACRHLLMFI